MGDMKCSGTPPWSALRMHPIRPRSWWGGSQDTIAESSSCPSLRWMASRLCRMLSLLTTTPFGVEVDPEVYCRNDTESRSVPGSSHRSASDGSSASVASQRIPPSPTTALSRPWASAYRTKSAVLSACVAEQSRAIAANRRADWPNLLVSNG